MPHFECDACKWRVYRAASSSEVVAERCPGCRAKLRVVHDPAEPADAGWSLGPELVDAFDDLAARRAARARARLID
jgi:hypothetical protein